MKRRKTAALQSLAFAAAFLCTALTGCSQTAKPSESAPEQSIAEITTAMPETTLSAVSETTVASEPEEPARFTFQPKVCSDLIRETIGETMCETWYQMVDAMMEGKESFACPDQETFDWVIGQFPALCFPVVQDMVSRSLIREPYFEDGVAYFSYTVPKEEFKEKVDQFAELIENILNETMKPDYTDFEKAYALYQYFTENYTYDRDHYNTLQTDILNARESSACHIFYDKTGICTEIASAYTYLLMQAGVNATVMSGECAYDGIGHAWSFIELDGKYYHIDPTFALGSNTLGYFLMTDAERENGGEFPIDTYIITSCYTQEHEAPVYHADDETFAFLWRTRISEIDREQKMLSVWKDNEEGNPELKQFSYKGY